MKEIILTVFGTMILSCLFNSVGVWIGMLPDMPPYPMGTKVVSVPESPLGLERADMCYPEISVTNGIKKTGYITRIDGKG